MGKGKVAAPRELKKKTKRKEKRNKEEEEINGLRLLLRRLQADVFFVQTDCFCRGFTSVLPERGVSTKRLFFFAAGPFLFANNRPFVAHIHSSQSPASIDGTESGHRWCQSLLNSFTSLRCQPRPISSAVQSRLRRWRRRRRRGSITGWRCIRIARILLA